MSEREGINLTNLAPADLLEMFPGAKLTIREKIPTNLLLLYTFLNINKIISNIKYSSDEIGEAVLALVAMIPGDLRDSQFAKDVKDSYGYVMVDCRPVFCTTPASFEYCARKKIPAFRKETQIDYFKMYHAVFDLLMRKGMLMKTQTTETFSDLVIIPEKEGKEDGRS